MTSATRASTYAAPSSNDADMVGMPLTPRPATAPGLVDAGAAEVSR
ncbi:hypothetical protein [Planobispora longispora]|nr:hypothetical protein [Planobispora longispora]